MKATYAVLDRNEQDPSKIDYYLHKFTVPQRTDPIPSFARKLKTVVKQRVFEMKKSAFKDWRKDNDQIFDDICTHDFEYWKVAKVCLDEEDYAEVELVFRAY